MARFSKIGGLEKDPPRHCRQSSGSDVVRMIAIINKKSQKKKSEAKVWTAGFISQGLPSRRSNSSSQIHLHWHIAPFTMSLTVIRIAGERNSVRNLKALRDKPSKYEVLIKVHAVSPNYRDIAVATSQYPFPVKDNLIPCSDAAGVVVEVGEGVKGIVKGDHVVVL